MNPFPSSQQPRRAGGNWRPEKRNVSIPFDTLSETPDPVRTL